MSDVPDTDPDAAVFAPAEPLDPAHDILRILARVAWRDRPELHLAYDDHADLLTVSVLPLPHTRERFAHDDLCVRLDGAGELGVPTEIRLTGFAARLRSPAAELARAIMGPTAWRRAVELIVDGRGHSRVLLSDHERDALVARWAEFADDVYVVGVQVLPGSLNAVLVDDRGDVVAQETVFVAETTPHAVVDATARLVARFGVRPGAVCLQIGGPVDPAHGVVLNYNKSGVYEDEWRDAPLAALVRTRVGLPTLVLNDVKALAVHERWTGLGTGNGRYGVLLAADGIGGAFVVDGTVDPAMPMEVGNFVIHRGGRKCRCGNHGCVEATAGSWAIVEQVGEAVECAVDDLAAAVQLAEGHDDAAALAQEVFKTAGEDLAAGIGSVQALMNLSEWAVHLPAELGGTSRAARQFQAGMDDFAQFVSYEPYRVCKLYKRITDGREGARGAAFAALEEFGYSGPAVLADKRPARKATDR